MIRAILSDVHGNLEALTAVVADARAAGADHFWCLGDTVGYGPNPGECVDQVSRFEISLLGNFDQAAILSPDEPLARHERTQAWTRAALTQGPPELVASRIDYLETRPRFWRDDSTLLCHASPRDPLYEYVFAEDALDSSRRRTWFRMFDRLCFVGHTHIPGVLLEDGRFLPPDQWATSGMSAGGASHDERRKLLVNVGSVGLPRDGDPRACYVLWDGRRVEFRRVAYDVAATIDKLRSHPDLRDPQTERWLRPAAT